jgi:hypothetical protein
MVEYAKNTENCQAGKQFGVLEKNIQEWCKMP